MDAATSHARECHRSFVSTTNPDTAIVLIEVVADGGLSMAATPRIFTGPDMTALADAAALQLYDAEQTVTRFGTEGDAITARQHWLYGLKSGRPMPLSEKRSLRRRLVVMER